MKDETIKTAYQIARENIFAQLGNIKRGKKSRGKCFNCNGHFCISKGYIGNRLFRVKKTLPLLTK